MTTEELRRLYEDRHMSLPQIAKASGLPLSTVRNRLVRAGVTLRSRKAAIQLRAHHLSECRRGRRRGPFTQEHRRNISRARHHHGEQHARGVSTTTSGYLAYTRGPHKNRLVHVVRMEARLGRRLLPDETVHHIDGDRQHNDDANLALVTRAGHARLHRREDELAGRQRARDDGGRFTGGRIDDAGADERNSPPDVGDGDGDDAQDGPPENAGDGGGNDAADGPPDDVGDDRPDRGPTDEPEENGKDA